MAHLFNFDGERVSPNLEMRVSVGIIRPQTHDLCDHVPRLGIILLLVSTIVIIKKVLSRIRSEKKMITKLISQSEKCAPIVL